jgi:AraC-like DNA-binding protein
MKPLLDRQPMLRSRDIEETRAYLAGKAIGLAVEGPARSRAPLDVRLNGIFLAHLWIGYLAYGAAATIRISPLSRVVCDPPGGGPGAASPAGDPWSRGDYWLQFPLHGRLEAVIAGSSIECDPRRAVVYSSVDEHLLRVDAGHARLSLSIRGDAMRDHLAALLGDAPAARLQFATALDLDGGHGRSLVRFVRFAVTEFDREGPLWSPLVAAQFEQYLMTGLLLSQPNNYTRLLRVRERPIAPRDVRRALDYIRENLAEPIALADLVAVSGVAGRTLIKHFADFNGVSPMRYVRNLRLERVRDELAIGAAESVTHAALRWGFGHAGRFSVEYRRRFGESPSVTLARANRR